MSTEVEKFIIEALANMNYDVSDVTGDTPLGPAGLDLESLSVAEVAIQVEDTYGVKFEEDEMETVALLTVAGLVKEIVDRVSAAAAAK
ncbi:MULTISPECIES: acyl carrier protein [unclassified Streptomyces]|uniref:acyl carrier protein n=1 Tax=unclassified Streptomyces TaxID=2593676 RepID=UPI002DD7D937|nr:MULTISPECIES: acyl carrier protein [unclassified Streptomyces]WRZ05901.1 acyl carrier protein [Streptomyces sp. NBC_00385]